MLVINRMLSIKAEALGNAGAAITVALRAIAILSVFVDKQAGYCLYRHCCKTAEGVSMQNVCMIY